MKNNILLLIFLLCSSCSAVLAQCRLLDRTTNLNATPVFAEEFSYSPTTNWLSDATFLNNWGPQADDYVAGGDKGATHYYSPSALEMTGGTLKIHATALATPIIYTGTNARTIYFKSGSLISQKQLPGNSGPGFSYGLYEIRCKLPQNPPRKSGIWPAFWLIGNGTEIDIFDQIDGTGPASKLSVGVLDWQKAYQDVSQGGCYLGKDSNGDDAFAPNCWTSGTIATKYGPDLSTQFNTYSMLWTPQGVTFFLNERAILSVPNSVVATHPGLARMLLQLKTNNLALASNGYAQIQSAEMEIDFIRVYSLKSLQTPQASYLTTNEYAHFNMIINNGNTTNQQQLASAALGAIATNATNGNEVFYIGTDNLIYRADRTSTTSNQWGGQALDGTAQTQNPNWKAASDLCHNPAFAFGGGVIYRGVDNRLQQYKRPWLGGPWQHSYVDASNTAAWSLLGKAGCLTLTNSGNIFYINASNEVQQYQYNSSTGNWSHGVMAYTYTSTTRAYGDIVAESGNGNVTIYYKGLDNKVQNFWWNSSWYDHSYVDLSAANTSGTNVNTVPGSISQIQNGNIFYIGLDHELHLLYWSNGWLNQVLTNGSNLPAKGNIVWDPSKQQVVYVGTDGHVKSYVRNGSIWTYSALDSYTNTDRYQVEVSDNTKYPSLAVGPAGNIFYRAHDNEMQYFNYESCSVLTPVAPGDNQSALNRPFSLGASALKQAPLVSVYPNPAVDNITIDVSGNAVDELEYDVYSAHGASLQHGKMRSNKTTLDIVKLPTGIYCLLVKGSGTKCHFKFVKQ